VRRSLPPQAIVANLAQLSVVIVLYDSADVIDGCIATLPPEVEVVVVDNASADDGLERAIALRPDSSALRSERNLGFGGGCNLGWHAASRPYVAFVNPDVRVRDQALSILLGRLEAEPHAMVGPALLDRSGATRRCKRRPTALLDAIGLLPAAARWAPVGWDGKLGRADPVHEAGGRVPTVEGACFILRRSDLEAIGGFDEDFFLYYEEESLALRLAGGAVYEPRAVVEHSGAASTARASALATRHLHRSRVIFYRKRDGELRGLLSGLILALAAAVSMLSAVVNAALRRPRARSLADDWHALRGVLQGVAAPLRSGVRY